MTGGVLDQVTVHLVDNLAELDECRRWAGSQLQGTLCADTESAGYKPHTDAHRLTQIGDMRHGWAFPPGWFGACNQILQQYTGRIGFFNSPYDHQVLAVNDGLHLDWARIDDAQLAGHIADSVRVNALKPRAAIEIDSRANQGEKLLKEGMRKQGWTWATVPVDFRPYWAYGALDPVLTSWLLEKFSPAVAQAPAAYDLELAYARLCAGMMTAGMMIDIPYINEQISAITAWNAHATAWLRDMWGVTSVRSAEQVEQALNRAGVPTLVRTATGLAATDKDTMAMYQAAYPHAAELITALRGAKKADDIIGKCLSKFLALASPDGVMHYSIHGTGAQRTGRSSVTDPPMQTFDRDVPIIRGSYVPRPGWVFVTIDADQIEARLAAHFSGDRQMIADFLEADRMGASFFLIMAGKIYGQQITKKDPRYTTTKNATYAQIYGSGLDTAAATAGITVEQMRPAYDGMRQLYPGLGRMMNQLINVNKRKGQRPQVRTLTGKTLYADRGKEYALVDYKIQGSAAEIMKYGGIALDAAGLGPYLRLSIHDEWLMECPAAEAEAVLREATRVLTDRTSFSVPLTWSGSILPTRWAKT